MTPLSRLTLAAANSCRTISSSPLHIGNPAREQAPFLATRKFGFEPEKSFIYNRLSLGAEPNEPTEPKEPKPAPHPPKTPSQFTNSLQTNNRLASFSHSPIQIAVPSPTNPQISSISSSVTAIHPCVQSPSIRTPSRKPWIMISPPASIPASRARATSAASGYEICSDR